MNVYISSDHGGFNLKQDLVNQLSSLGVKITDLGPQSIDPLDDYPDYAFSLADKVSKDPHSLGILICRSGNGMCIAANKVKGAYASLCFSKQHAKKAREDDNANILCLDADYVDGDAPTDIVNEFLKAQFNGMDTKYGRRFKKIQAYEEEKFHA